MQMVLHQPADSRRENALQHLAAQARVITSSNRLSRVVKQRGGLELWIIAGVFRQLVDLERMKQCISFGMISGGLLYGFEIVEKRHQIGAQVPLRFRRKGRENRL